MFLHKRMLLKDCLIHPVSRLLTIAALMLPGCGKDEPLYVDYAVRASVSNVVDKANPIQRSDDLLFTNIPDFEALEYKNQIRVIATDFFQVLCEADQFLIYPNKERILLKGWSGESPDGKDFTYIVPSDGTGASLYTRDEALKVNRKQLEDSIKEIVIKVGGRVVDRVSVYGQDGVSLRTNHEIVRAAEFPLGANLVVCEFKTKDGKTYNATAAVEILDNKPQFIGVDGNFAALHQ